MDRTRKLLAEAGCILEGEYFFALKKKGLVSKKYINIDPLQTDPIILQEIVHAMVRPFRGQFNCLVGPAVGGIALVYTAAAICNNWTRHDKVWTAYADKDGDEFTFTRMGFTAAVKDKQVLVLEDISSTGGSVNQTITQIRASGGQVIGTSLIWNRGGLTPDQIGTPKLESLVTESVETWDVNKSPPPGWGQLPLVNDIGHPDYYPDYRGGSISLTK